MQKTNLLEYNKTKESCENTVLEFLCTCFSSTLKNKIEITKENHIEVLLSNGNKMIIKIKGDKKNGNK